MARIFLPPPSRTGLDFYRYRVVLDGAPYFFEYRLNDRVDRYHVSVEDAANTVLVQSKRVVLDTDLFRVYRHKNIPPGRIVVVDSEDGSVEPGKGELFGRVLVAYDEAT